MTIGSRLQRLLVAVAVMASVSASLSACQFGAPEVPPPAPYTPANNGISVMADDKSVALRDLYIVDPGPAGYAAGSSAPLAAQVWNNTTMLVSLTGAVVNDEPLVLVGMGEATGSLPPSTASFAVEIPPGGSIPLSQQAGRYLQIVCAPSRLSTGDVVAVTFTFSNNTVVVANVPVGGGLADLAPSPAPAAASC